MTINEAINIISAAQGECEWNAPLDYQNAFDIALEAMQKQVPKKAYYNQPTKVKAFDGESQMVAIFDCVPCPVCGKWIVSNIRHKFCQYCGQALDWGNTEEVIE